ncbi:unnamed protein product [Callosobruchus maculatus]|uniref:C2H2-type domain-containing protein n=1 Tax=Callosobruchus maculatus TaxID=64391 RepID=A0A653DSL0_CALMS|nr:unnamed protein product [Callosobruchus maculatus]
MKKKPQLPRKLGKPNALRKSVLSNRRDIENNNENKQLSQCVFLGVLRLKPVPTTFSRTTVPSGSTSFISHRLRRHRNNSIAKESSKKPTKGIDLNKVISGKITKKNPDKVRACVKKNPLGTSKVLRICLTMNRAMMNLQSNNSEVVNVTDIPFPSTSFVVTQPSFNPVDNLFNKLKQQLKHAESPGSLDVSLLSSTVAKMNASKQLTTHAVKAKRKQSDNLTVSNDSNSDDIIWISDSGAIEHNTQTSNDDIIFIDDSRAVDASSSHVKSLSLKGTSTSTTVLTDAEKPQNSHIRQNSIDNQVVISTESTKSKQATSSDQTQKIYDVDDHDSSSEGVSHNKSIDKQKEKAKSRRNRLIPAEIPLKYVNAPRLLRSELYQKADQKRSTSLEGKDRTKEKSKSLKSEKVTFTIIKSSSDHNLSQKSRPELTVRKQKSQDTSPAETSTSVKERKKSSSPKNKTSDRWEITSSTQLSDQAVNISGSSQKIAGQVEQPVSFKLKLTKTTRSAVAAAKATQSKGMVTDEVIYVDNTKKDTSLDTSLERPPVDNGESLHNAINSESNTVTNRLFTPRLLRSDLTIQKPTTKISKNTNFTINPTKAITRNVTIKDLNTSVPTQTAANISDNEDVLIIIDDADDTNINLQAPARSLEKNSQEKVAVIHPIPVAEHAGNEGVPRVLRSDISQLIQCPVPNKPENATLHSTKIIEELSNTEKTRNLRSEASVRSSNKELKDNQKESAAQNQVISAEEEPSSKGTIFPRVLRSDVSQNTLSITTVEEQNHLVASKSVTGVDKFTEKESISPTNVHRSSTTETEHQPEQSEEKHNTVVPGRVLRSEAYKTITNEGLQEKHDQVREQPKAIAHPTNANEEKRVVRSDVAKVTEICQVQLNLQSAENQNLSGKSLRTLRSVSPQKSASPPKSNEMQKVDEKDRSVDVKRFYSAQSSKISSLSNKSSEPAAVPSKSLQSSSAQIQQDVAPKSKENLLITTGKEQLTYPATSSITQEGSAPKLPVENPPSRMLRSDPKNIPDNVSSQKKSKKHEQQKKLELAQEASHQSSALTICKDKMDHASRRAAADENSNNNPDILLTTSKESTGSGTKVARSRSSSPNKAKNVNFDEIIVLSDKKSRKTKDASMKIITKTDQRLPVKQTNRETNIVEPAEEVVVIIHEEPKSKSAPLLEVNREVNNANQEDGNTELLRHNLRSQKYVPADVPKQPDVDSIMNTVSVTENSTKLNDANSRLLRSQQASSSQSNPEKEISTKGICAGGKIETVKTTEVEVITQVTPSHSNYDTSELQRVATARVLRSEAKNSDSDNVSQDSKAESPASSDAKKVSFKNTPEVFVSTDTTKKATKGNLKKKINDIIKETSMGRSILKKGKLGAKGKIIKTMSKAFGKKQTLKVKVRAPNASKNTENIIKPVENIVKETVCYNLETTNTSENSESVIKDKIKKIKAGKKIVFATKTKEHTKRDKKQQKTQKIDLKKGKALVKGKNSLPLALRRLLTDGRISRKTIATLGTKVSNTDDSESNKENVISKVENVVEKNIGPKVKKEQTKQKLLARMKQTISKSTNKELKMGKKDKKGDGKPRVRNSNGTPPKRNVQKKMITTPPRKKNLEKVAFFKKSKPGKGGKSKVDKKEKKGKTNVTKAVKSVVKLDKANKIPVSNVENNSTGVLDNRRTSRMSTATTESQTNVPQKTKSKKDKPKQSKKSLAQDQMNGKDYTSKPGDSSNIKTDSLDKKNKSKKNKKGSPEAIDQDKVSKKSMKISQKRKRKEEVSSVKKIKLSNESCEHNSAYANAANENKSTSHKNISSVKASASTSNKKGKIKKNKVDVQVQTVPAVDNLKLAINSHSKEKKKKSMPNKSGDKISDGSSNVVSPRPRVSLRKNRIVQQTEDANQEIQNSTSGTETTKKEKEIPIEIKDADTNIGQKRERKSIPEAEKAVGPTKSRGGKSLVINKRLSKRACVIQQGEQEASKKECDVKKPLIVASCDSAVNTTITLPPGTSIEPIVIEDVKEEDPNKSNTLINNNIPAKSSLSVFDFNESDMELNTPPLLTLQNIREEIKEKYTYQKEHGQDVTYVVHDDRSGRNTEINNVTYTLSSSNPTQDHNKTYTTLNPVPNASSKDALSALNTSISVKEPESNTFSPPQKSTPKMTKSTSQVKGPKLYSVIPAEEIVRKRIEQAAHLKVQQSQSIDLTSVSEQQVIVQERQIQVRRPSQICDLSKNKHNLLTSAGGVEISGNPIQVKADKVSPATSNSSTFEDLFKSPIKSPKKSPLKQTTILDMFAKMQQKNIIKSIFSQPETSQQGSKMEPQMQQQQQPTFTTLSRLPKDTSITPEVAAPMKESDSSDMPPPKLSAYGEDEDSDGESRMEWVPEEYAEYKFKYTAKKVMSYKPIYKCKVCLQMFPTYYKLNKHKREHSETDNPYKCPQCESSFNSVADLAAHIRVHKGKHPYTCKKCDTGFWTKEELDEHVSIHLLKKIKPPEKKFRCDVCLKEFSRLFEVERHIRVHTGEKPFTCNICNKGYQQRHNLSKHLLIHLDVRPFHCEICGKAFGRSDVLDRHVLTHSVAKPVKCPHCDKDFIRHMQLKNHMKKRHKEFYDENSVYGVAAPKDESSGDPASTPPKEETVQPQGTETKSVEPKPTEPLATA